MLDVGAIQQTTFAAPIHSILPGLVLLMNGLSHSEVYHLRIIGPTCDGGGVITLGLIRLPPRSNLNKVEASAWDGHSQY